MRSAPIISDHLGWLSAIVAAITADITCAFSQLLISMLETSLVSMSGPLHQKRPLKAQQSQCYGFVCVPVSSIRYTLHLSCKAHLCGRICSVAVAHLFSFQQLILRITRICFLEFSSLFKSLHALATISLLWWHVHLQRMGNNPFLPAMCHSHEIAALANNNDPTNYQWTKSSPALYIFFLLLLFFWEAVSLEYATIGKERRNFHFMPTLSKQNFIWKDLFTVFVDHGSSNSSNDGEERHTWWISVPWKLHFMTVVAQ